MQLLQNFRRISCIECIENRTEVDNERYYFFPHKIDEKWGFPLIILNNGIVLVMVLSHVEGTRSDSMRA